MSLRFSIIGTHLERLIIPSRKFKAGFVRIADNCIRDGDFDTSTSTVCSWGIVSLHFSPSLGLPRWDSCILRPFHMGDSARRMAGQYLLMV